MASIYPTVQINISRTPGKIENVSIGADCSPEETLIYTNLFKEFQDVLIWSYEEMLGIDPIFSNMRLGLTRMLNPFDNILEMLILGRTLLLRHR
jgi:hypothetical protein